MKSMLTGAFGLALVALLCLGSLTEGIKFAARLPEQPEVGPALLAGPLYPATDLQQPQQQQELKADLGTKGGEIKESEESVRQRPQQPYYPPPQQQPYYPPPQQPYYPQQQGPYGNRPTTWVIIRPVLGSTYLDRQQQQPYYSSYLFRPQEAPQQWLLPPVQQQPLVESGLAQPQASGLKGGEQVAKQEQALEEAGLTVAAEAPAPARGADKFAKLKSSFDKLKAKLTLGSSYLVQSEEILAPAPAPLPTLVQREPLAQPLEQQQLKQGQEEDIRLTQQEQQTIKEAERQEQEQVQSLEQEKLSSVKQQLGAGEGLPGARKQQQQEQSQDSFDRRQQQSRPINEQSAEAALASGQHQDIQRISKQQQ